MKYLYRYGETDEYKIVQPLGKLSSINCELIDFY